MKPSLASMKRSLYSTPSVTRRGAAMGALFLFAVFIVGITIRGTSETPFVLAASVEELQSKIDERNQSIKQLEAEIAQYRSQLDTVGKQKTTLQNTIKEIDLTQKKLAADILLTGKKIEATTLTIEQLDRDIATKEKQIGASTLVVYESIVKLDEKEQTSLIETLLSSPKTSAVWDEAERLIELRDGIRLHLHDLKELRAELQSKRAENAAQQKRLLALKRDLSDQKVIIEANRRDKANLLAATKNQETAYAKILAEKQALQKAFADELAAYEAQLKFAIDLSKLPTVGKGVIGWPLDAVYITQQFGQTAFSKTAAGAVYNGNGHNGIDLRAAIGTPVKAAETGVVIGAGDTDLVCKGASYGKWVLIRHDNGLSTIYGHNSVIRVSQNQRVAKGETIALSGNSGYATGPHLHFSVLASDGVQVVQRKSKVCAGTYTMPVADLRAYLNPLLYL